MHLNKIKYSNDLYVHIYIHIHNIKISNKQINFLLKTETFKIMEGRKVTGWAARDSSAILSPYSFHLRYVNQSMSLLINNKYCFCILILKTVIIVSNMQENRSRRCIVQGVVLWSWSQWSSSTEERNSLHYLPFSCRVRFSVFPVVIHA